MKLGRYPTLGNDDAHAAFLRLLGITTAAAVAASREKSNDGSAKAQMEIERLNGLRLF